jgi:hypothetical protein
MKNCVYVDMDVKKIRNSKEELLGSLFSPYNIKDVTVYNIYGEEKALIVAGGYHPFTEKDVSKFYCSNIPR